MAFTAIASPTSRLPCCSPCSASSPPSPTAGSSCAATSSNEGGLMDFLAELLVSALIVIGGIFGLVGSYGLVKLPDLMTRLHSTTKSSSLGIGGVLLASMIYGVWQNGWPSTPELLITLFVFLPDRKSTRLHSSHKCAN